MSREISKQIWGLGFDEDAETLLILMQHTDAELFTAAPQVVTTLLCASRDIPSLEQERLRLVERLREAWIERYDSDDWLNRLAKPLGPGPRIKDFLPPRK